MPEPPDIHIADPEEPARVWIEPNYSAIEMRIAAQVAPVQPAVGDRVRIGEDEWTVTSVTGRGVVINPETERPAHYTPGGAALRYAATTRIRFPARRREPPDPLHENFVTRFCMRKLPEVPMTNPCGEISLGFTRPMDQHVAGDCTFSATLIGTKIHEAVLAEALKKPYRSVWWWLRNPIV